ncbi:MAG: rhodanese-like domain-containing protein [Tannerella sp.]|jgi:rhodanese-related sulfurtransferase|nr:rhodanese-like domain-containing protein [Tannerella sp.]
MKAIILTVILVLIALGVLFALLLLLLFIIARVSKHYQCLDVYEFEKQLIITRERQLIDVCTPREFEKYHIRGAKNIDFRSSDFRKEIENLNRTIPVFIYCLSGVRSKLSAYQFKKAGFKTIYELNMGLRAWLKAGRPVTTGSN